MALIEIDLSQFDDRDLVKEMKARNLGDIGVDGESLVFGLLDKATYRDDFIEALEHERCPTALREEFESWLRNPVVYNLTQELRAGRYAPHEVP